ncbi:RASEF protein, partial [Eudromia elegans]|nr:RASEF protein [Eudromia elegans]
LAGDSGAGKSSFLLRFCSNEFSGNMPSTLGTRARVDRRMLWAGPDCLLAGVDFRMKRLLVDGEQTTLQIWDTAGQERFRSVARSYFRKAHGVLLLYDVSS